MLREMFCFGLLLLIIMCAGCTIDNDEPIKDGRTVDLDYKMELSSSELTINKTSITVRFIVNNEYDEDIKLNNTGSYQIVRASNGLTRVKGKIYIAEEYDNSVIGPGINVIYSLQISTETLWNEPLFVKEKVVGLYQISFEIWPGHGSNIETFEVVE